jgi:hypothetical protein
MNEEQRAKDFTIPIKRIGTGTVHESTQSNIRQREKDYSREIHERREKEI